MLLYEEYDIIPMNRGGVHVAFHPAPGPIGPMYPEEREESAVFDSVVAPVVSLLNSLVGPLLAIVGAVGVLYCVILGVKYAKAEEPQEREKAKGALKNAIIGFVLIFVLILVLNLLMPVMIKWVNANASKPIVSVAG